MKQSHNLQLSKHLVALLQQSSGVRDELVNNSLGRLLFRHNGSDLAHQERPSVVQRLVVNVIGQVLEIVLDGDDTLGGQLLDFFLAVLFPVLDVGVVADAQGTAL